MTDKQEDGQAIDLVLRAKETFAKIESLAQQLQGHLRPCDMPHVVFRVPVRETLSPPKFVRVQKLTGYDAWNAGVEAFSEFYRRERQHPSAPFRLPGVLYVDNFQEVEPIIDALNQEKRNLKALFTEIDSGKRRRFATKHLPGLMLLQVYRPVESFSQHVRRGVFSWVSTSTSKKISIDEAKKKVQAELDALLISGVIPGENGTIEEWESVLNNDLIKLEQLRGVAELRMYRPVSPHPRLMLFDGETEGSPSAPFRTYHANTPLLVSSADAFAIRDLPDFDASRAHKTRKDKKDKELIIPRHFIFSLKDDKGTNT
jgi:hypothetical protein